MTDRKRLDTKLESEAAEFLVLGHLLLERITAFKAYVNYPGYDLIAVDEQNKRSAKIQVKSRFRTDWDGFIINNIDCDFVVFVALNRGQGRTKAGMDIKAPDFYVLPRKYVEDVRDATNLWGKIVKSRLVDIEKYKDNWDLIRAHLKQTS